MDLPFLVRNLFLEVSRKDKFMPPLTRLILILLQISYVGPITVLNFLATGVDPVTVLSNNGKTFPKRISKQLWDEYEKRAQEQWDLAQELGVTIINYQDATYPQRLLNLDNFPPIIYAKGDQSLLNRPKLTAVIGTREPQATTIKQGQRLTKYLVSRDHVIVAGLALGCDTVAHKTCLQNNGQTIAVLAHGLAQKIYPSENIELAQEIIESGGLLLTTYPPMTKVAPFRLAERDQWQSGLSDKVIVLETNENSGTNITIKYARKQKREVIILKNQINN